MTFLQHLAQWDLAAFAWLNGLHTPWLDPVMKLISDRFVWIPAYAVLFFAAYRKLGKRAFLLMLPTVVILITLCDQTASGLLKPWIGRFRPCRPEAALDIAVHIVDGHCGGKYGFVSSHAANFFGAATFFSILFQRRTLTWLFFFIAALVAYSRIYLGVHYPGDVLGGALVGLFWGWTVARAFGWGRQRLG